MHRLLALALLCLPALAHAETEKPLPVKPAAGVTFTMAITSTGVTVYFPSGYTLPQENPRGTTVYPSSGAVFTAAVTATGATVYFPSGFVLPPTNSQGTTVYPSSGAVFVAAITSTGATVYFPAGTVLTVTQNPGATWYTQPAPATLTVTATGAADAAITLSIPSASGLFHYITSIEIIKYVTAAIPASATPVIITTTNLNSRDFNFRRYGAVADTEVAQYDLSSPWRSAAVTTATTIVCPAVTGVKWIVTVHYYTAP